MTEKQRLSHVEHAALAEDDILRQGHHRKDQEGDRHRLPARIEQESAEPPSP